nr:receptor type tyrosine protein phosphatase delta [Hymenolepis microstoma]
MIPRSEVRGTENIQLMKPLSLPGQSPIFLNALAVHVANFESFDNNKLYKEYEAIEQGSGFTWHHANMELDKPKNRYANVIAHDHSLVLPNQILGVQCSDYMNANYLDGYRRPNAYIATQARLTLNYAYYTNRTFNLQKMVSLSNFNEANSQNFNGGYNSEGENHHPVQKPSQIKQSQFTSWPDCRAPERPQPLLLFIRQACQARQALGPKQSLRGGQENGVSENLLQNTLPNRLGPTVTHCSAGVGRPELIPHVDGKPFKQIDVESRVDEVKNAKITPKSCSTVSLL